MVRRFEFEEGGSSKFWEVSVDGTDMTVTFGRIGTNGQTKTKGFASADAAQKEADKLIAEKTKKGYAEVGGDATDAAAAERPSPKPAAAKPAPAAKATASAATSASAAVTSASSEPAEASEGAAKSSGDVAKPTAPVEAGGRSGPSMVLDGETVWFVPSALAIEAAEVPLDRPLAKKRGQSFEKMWADLFAQHAQWSAGKHHSYRWHNDHPKATPEARALGERVKKRLDDKEMGEGFDVALEAATYALIGFSYYNAADRPSRVLWHWTERVGPEKAVEALVQSKRYAPFNGGGEQGWPRPLFFEIHETLPDNWGLFHHSELSGLRELARAFGRAPVERGLASVSNRKSLGDRAAIAWLFDDVAAARALIEEGVSAANVALLGLLLPFVEDPAIAEQLLPNLYQDGPDGGSVARVVLARGLEFAPLVFAHAGKEPNHARRWAAVLACYPSMQAARLLVPLLENKTNRKLVSDALAAMPAEAVRALSEASKKKLKYRDAIDSLIATFTASAQAASGEADEDAGEEAPLDALPSALAAPPWRAKRKAAKAMTVEGLVPRSLERTVDFSGADEKKLAQWVARVPGMVRHGAESLRVAVTNNTWIDPSSVLGLTAEELEALHAEGVMRKIGNKYWSPDAWTPGPSVALKKVGPRAIPALVALAPNVSLKYAAELEYGGAVEIAPLVTDWMGGKATRGAAYSWSKRFPRHAAAGLIPIALGKTSAARDRATLLLLSVAHAGHGEVVLEEAAHHGAEVAEAIKALLERDPLELVPAKLPKIPDGLENLTRPRLKDGRVLSRDATNLIVEMLSFSPIDPPYAGLEQVKEACDARSLDAFVESMVRAWVAGGMVPAHEWCVRAVALLGSDKAARFLYDRGRAWALDNAKQRALLSLDVLGAMGTDLALSLIGRVSRSGARQYMKDRAVEILGEIAGARGLTADELEDRTAPDLGLDENGSMLFDFGPRSFRAGFDEHLRPFVQTADGGERLESFPRAQKTDEAEKAKAASEAWKHLRTEAEKVAKDQIARLERMMGEERRVEADVFVQSFVKHPLVGHLAKRLVWGAFDASGVLLGTFRVAEDQTFATVEDDAFELPDDARVGVIHPYALKDAPGLVARWGQQLSDYAIAQPFGQLTREVLELDVGQLLTRYTDKQAPTGLLFGLRAFGWRALVQEYGDIEGFERSVGGARIVVGIDPWLQQGESKIHKLRVHASTQADQAPPTPVQMSEIAFQLDGVVVK